MLCAANERKINPAIAPKMTQGVTPAPKVTTLDAHKNMSGLKVDSSKAQLLDVFIQILNGYDGKDHDTHWSTGLFDQHDNPISSFHDDSNTDEYVGGTWVGSLKMHSDRAATFGDFANAGRFHINIAPNGNDTWQFGFFVTLDFINPKFSKTISWGNVTVSQDKRDADLFFAYDGSNFVIK